MRRQRVLGEVDRQLVHPPRPGESRAGDQRQPRFTPQDAHVAMRVAADRRASVACQRRAVDLPRTQGPQIFPVFGRRHRIVEPLGLGQHQARDARVLRQVPEQAVDVGLPAPAQHEHRQATGDLRILFRRRAEPAAGVGPFARKVAREPKPAGLLRNERVGCARAAEHRAPVADAIPQLERRPDPDVERPRQEDAAIGQHRDDLARDEVDSRVVPRRLGGWQPEKGVSARQVRRQRSEPRLERGTELRITDGWRCRPR